MRSWTTLFILFSFILFSSFVWYNANFFYPVILIYIVEVYKSQQKTINTHWYYFYMHWVVFLFVRDYSCFGCDLSFKYIYWTEWLCCEVFYVSHENLEANLVSWVCTFNFYYFNLSIVASLLLKFCQTPKTELYIFINASNIHSQISLVLLNVVSFYNLCNVV